MVLIVIGRESLDPLAAMAELVDAQVSDAWGRKPVPVRFRVAAL
jgi:hypothetical protein